MDQAHNEKTDPAGEIQGGKVKASGADDIGCQNNNGGNKLEQCPVQTGNCRDKLIQDNNGSIKTGSTQSEKNAGQI